MRRGSSLALVLVMGGAGLLPVQARVFQLRGRRGSVEDQAYRMGWSLAYTATMDLANGPAEVAVFGDVPHLAGALQALDTYYRNLGVPAAFTPGGDLGWGLAELDGRVHRYVVVAPREGMGTLVYRIDQSRRDVEKLREGQTERRLTGLPEPVSGEPGLFARDPARRVGVDMLTTTLDVEAAARQTDQAMRAAGWVAPLGAAGSSALYVKGAETVVISYLAQNRGTTITRLHRQGGGRSE